MNVGTLGKKKKINRYYLLEFDPACVKGLHFGWICRLFSGGILYV